jgi:hypothetical protein
MKRQIFWGEVFVLKDDISVYIYSPFCVQAKIIKLVGLKKWWALKSN